MGGGRFQINLIAGEMVCKLLFQSIVNESVIAGSLAKSFFFIRDDSQVSGRRTKISKKKRSFVILSMSIWPTVIF